VTIRAVLDTSAIQAYAVGKLIGEFSDEDAVWLPLDRDQWRPVAAAADLLGSIARACAALPVVLGQADYLVTAEPDAYPGLNTIDT